MALNRLSELKGVAVQIVCAVAIQFESAWTFTNIAAETTCRASSVPGPAVSLDCSGLL